MTGKAIFSIELLENIGRFLKAVEDSGESNKEDILSCASEEKECLSDFFDNFTSQFCEKEFGIKSGSSDAVYSIELRKEEVLKDKDHEEILRKLVKNIREIISNRSDYLEQEYLEIAHELEEFIYKVFPKFLENVKQYSIANGAHEHSKRIEGLQSYWGKVFNE